MWVLVCLNLKFEKNLNPFLKISHKFNVNLPQISCHWWKIINERKDSSEKRHTPISHSMQLCFFCVWPIISQSISYLPFSAKAPNPDPRKKSSAHTSSKQVVNATVFCFLLVLFSGFFLLISISDAHFTKTSGIPFFVVWTGWKNGGFQFCILVFLLSSSLFLYDYLRVLFFSFVFDEIAVWA